MSEDKFIYTKIDENTYETHDPSTNMKIILSFADVDEAEDKRIDDFFINMLSNIYLRRMCKTIEDNAIIPLKEKTDVIKSKYFYKQT